MNTKKSLQIGTALLSVWSILNIVPGLISAVSILLGNHAPAFMYLFTKSEIAALDQKVLATTDCVALLLNTLIVSFFIMVFFVIKYELKQSSKWSFWVLLFSIGIAQIASFIADSYLNNKNIIVNLISCLMMIIGFGFSAYAIFSKKNL